MRLAGDASAYVEAIRLFARNLGVAFQILNDLNDWQAISTTNCRRVVMRWVSNPTVLFALALASLNAEDQAELIRLTSPDCELVPAERVRRIERLYRKAKAFDQPVAW